MPFDPKTYDLEKNQKWGSILESAIEFMEHSEETECLIPFEHSPHYSAKSRAIEYSKQLSRYKRAWYVQHEGQEEAEHFEGITVTSNIKLEPPAVVIRKKTEITSVMFTTPSGKTKEVEL